MAIDPSRICMGLLGRVDDALGGASHVVSGDYLQKSRGIALSVRKLDVVDAEGFNAAPMCRSNAVGAAPAPRKFLIEKATLADVPGICEVIYEGVLAGYRNLPVEAGKPGAPGLIHDMKTREFSKPVQYMQSIAAGKNLTLVNRDGAGVAGCSEFIPTDEGAEWLTFHIREDLQGSGLAKALLHKTLLATGDVDLWGTTTIGAKALEIYLHYGFVKVGDVLPTPGPMAAQGLVAPQQRVVLRSGAPHRALLERLAPYASE